MQDWCFIKTAFPGKSLPLIGIKFRPPAQFWLCYAFYEFEPKYVLLKKVNPLALLILLSIVLFFLRKTLFPEYSDSAIIGHLEAFLSAFGLLSIVYVLAIYFVCSFFFIPILIPLNIACGALYGPGPGALMGMAGILVSCVASTISVRHVFKGIGNFARRNQDIRKFLKQISRHGTIVAIMLRLAFVVPYLVQNVVLAMTTMRLDRLLLLTLVGGFPGVVSYSFLGAGLVSLDDAGTFAIYLLVPLFLLVAVTAINYVMRNQMGIGRNQD